jgi:hypothetical protein
MKWLLAVVAVGAAVMIAMEMPSIVRYIKIERM